MADADELLRDAQYAFQSISYGDTRDNRKFTARAKSFAKKIIRKFPESVEASQARAILDRLEGKIDEPKFDHDHARDNQLQSHTAPHGPIISKVESLHKRGVESSRSTASESGEREHSSTANERREKVTLNWQELWTGFVQLELTKQLTVIAGIVFFGLFFGVFSFIFIGAAIYFSGFLQKQYPYRFSRIRHEIIKPVDAWLRKNKAK